MNNQQDTVHGSWSGGWAFILAATGSAVGLGNIWKFPYITGENGGGAFVLVYLMCIALIGIPIMMAEILLGRRGRSTPINTMMKLAKEAGAHPAWKIIGWSGMLAGFLILSFYSVIAGWGLAYILESGSGSFIGADAKATEALFGELLGSPFTLIFWHTLFIVMTMLVVSKGVRHGLEKAVRFLMPSLFILLIIMVGYAMSLGEFSQGVKFLFEPDFDKLTGNSVLIAMGHAFFTLSLGMGAIMIYGAYLPQHVPIAKTAFIIAGADTVVALLAGLAIFPIVFAYGLEPGAGPGLIFQTLPIAFGNMPAGLFFGTLFFILLVFAAWTSAISLIEPAVTWLVENKNMRRITACQLAGFVTWLLGLATVFSFNIWSEVKLFGETAFGLIDYLTANIMLPLGGLFMAIFVAYVLPKTISQNELNMNDGLTYKIWHSLVRYFTPVAVIIVFFSAINII